MRYLGAILSLFLFVASAQADSQKCIGPIQMSVAGIKYFNFGTQLQGYNDTFTLTAVVTGTVSAQVRASLDTGCVGGANSGAACSVNSQCPSGFCSSGFSSGMPIPKDRAGVALPTISATTFQQFDGPWNVIQVDLATCTTCTFTYNICGKDL